MVDNKPKDLLDEIFSKALSVQSLYKDRNVLRSDYIPLKLPFREKQIVAMGEALAPLLHKSKCSNLFIYGKPGTGKTAVAKYVLQRLEEKALTPNLKIKFAYTNTRVAGTEYRVLFDMAQSIGLSVPFTGLALNEVFRRITSEIESSTLTVILVIDEIDFLIKKYSDDLLYELTRVNEQLPKGYVAIIGISNDLNFKEFLNPRVLSSLSEEEIIFSPYTAEELRAILSDRAKIAFFDNIVTEASINLCAALAGSEHGDARRALDLLRVSGEVAERECATKVEERHVRIAVQKIEQDRIVEVLKSLPLHAKLLLWTITSSEGVHSTGEVYEYYSKLCQKINVDELTPRRVTMLISELDLLGLIVAKIISKGRYGRTKQINPLIQLQLVREVFSEDLIMNSIL
ncbi:MAG: orc1/cdc6 family replication initiation protein [Candidatus Methylarchaceae archaeon HK02M1]|nr:orc1/cdc6 family replication initiation protein [Candidatus Methylarchaceae archaeon HK02M1]